LLLLLSIPFSQRSVACHACLLLSSFHKTKCRHLIGNDFSMNGKAKEGKREPAKFFFMSFTCAIQQQQQQQQQASKRPSFLGSSAAKSRQISLAASSQKIPMLAHSLACSLDADFAGSVLVQYKLNSFDSLRVACSTSNWAFCCFPSIIGFHKMSVNA